MIDFGVIKLVLYTAGPAVVAAWAVWLLLRARLPMVDRACLISYLVVASATVLIAATQSGGRIPHVGYALALPLLFVLAFVLRWIGGASGPARRFYPAAGCLLLPIAIACATVGAVGWAFMRLGT